MKKALRVPFLMQSPVVLVSCQGAQGKSNIVTNTLLTKVCDEPTLVGIALRKIRFSYGLIKETREFVINIPSEDLLWEIDICGWVTGKEEDKFEP